MTHITIINLVVRYHGSIYAPQGGGVTPVYGLNGEDPPKCGTFFRLQVYEKVGISLVEVYERVGRSVKKTKTNPLQKCVTQQVIYQV